jgi:hypothetical protein
MLVMFNSQATNWQVSVLLFGNNSPPFSSCGLSRVVVVVVVVVVGVLIVVVVVVVVVAVA